jgi:hypothetical protein
MQIPAADDVYAPPPASFEEYNQDESFVQIAAAGSFRENDQYDSSLQIPTADDVYAPPPASFQEYNQEWSLHANFH